MWIDTQLWASIDNLWGGSELKVNNVILCTILQHLLSDSSNSSMSGCDCVYHSKEFECLWQRPGACKQDQR